MWWNGRHDGLRSRCREAWEFESLHPHQSVRYKMTKTKLAHSFTVVIPAQEFQDKIAAKLEEVRKEAKIQGFRPGQAPISLIKSKYENAVKGEVLDDLIQEIKENAKSTSSTILTTNLMFLDLLIQSLN